MPKLQLWFPIIKIGVTSGISGHIININMNSCIKWTKVCESKLVLIHTGVLYFKILCLYVQVCEMKWLQSTLKWWAQKYYISLYI